MNKVRTCLLAYHSSTSCTSEIPKTTHDLENVNFCKEIISNNGKSKLNFLHHNVEFELMIWEAVDITWKRMLTSFYKIQHWAVMQEKNNNIAFTTNLNLVTRTPSNNICSHNRHSYHLGLEIRNISIEAKLSYLVSFGLFFFLTFLKRFNFTDLYLQICYLFCNNLSNKLSYPV